MRLLLIIVLSFLPLSAMQAASIFTLSGTVKDAATGEVLDYATISVSGAEKIATHSDGEGRWSLRLPAGKYTVVGSYVGYKAVTKTVTLDGDTRLSLELHEQSNDLSEVVVTARESGSLSSGSRIDRSAMEHLQPTSFSDLLELLPGNISQNPSMGQANSITLRETGGMTATGAKSTLSDDYAITSLGTAFVVDGAVINEDANLQRVPNATSTDADGKRSSVNRGVDMRTISTDNIESVEVIRGIPSAEYGNLTSGVVNISRISHATPLTGRFKADSFSKLLSLSKGVKLGNHVVVADLGYLDSKIDPRDNLENYKRINGSVRGNLSFPGAFINTRWNVGVDYTGSFDNSKVDPDLNYNKIDEYKSSYNRFAFTSDLKLNFVQLNWLKMITFNSSASYQHDRLERHKQVAPQRASVAPSSMEEGVHDGTYLLSEYLADFVSDGRPFNLFMKLRADGSAATGTWLNNYKVGAEWTISKNFGHGQIYDLSRPLSASWTTRPRDYSTIPALHVLSFYAEDQMSLNIAGNQLALQLGARTIQLPSLDSRYYLAGKVYIDPRFNAEWSFPSLNVAGRQLKFRLAGGYGVTTKMPTIDYLYPQANYNDFIQLNYYDVNRPAEYSRVSLRTYIDDPTNYELRAARNHKWELRFGADYGDNRFTITYFQEKMTSGFRYSTVYSTYGYRRYDASGIDATLLSGKPSLDDLPYEDVQVLDGLSKVTNGSRIDKRGVEFQLNTARWQPLRTSLIISGAWFKSRYSNSQMLYSTVTDVVGNTAVKDLYVGLYNMNDGRINEQFNTNFTFDTQIPRWGLVFTTSLQCMWWMKTTRLWQNGVPDYYLSAADGQLHAYTEADRSDLVLQYLVKNYNEESFKTQTVPTALYLNLKVTKKIGRWLKMSAFVNRIVDYLPDYKSNGLTIRRTSDAYFGMEAVVTL
jgi:hypothetical protein